MSARRDRSRSPIRGDNGSRRRDMKNQDPNKNPENMPNVMNPMMMPNMFTQGNMMMPGMFNMMMPNHIMGGGMMQPPGMDMMQGPAMEMIPQPPIDMASMGNHQPLPAGPPPLEMGMMGGVMMDSMMGMFPNISGDASQEKKEIILKHCKLIPPPPGTQLPPRRTRPPGCRTIFVGGLPDKIRESTVREIFERYGRIQILRLSKKNFCHIRFDRETCVDAAMFITGYRIKISSKDKDEKEDEDDTQSTTGWLHVDYALSRDDQNEYERRQRQALRVQQQQMQQQLTAQQEVLASHNMNYRRSPSPTTVRIQPFSNSAIVQLAEKIKNEEHFPSTLPTLISWLERGECSKKNANQFYSMIQATNSHIRRLFNEKMQSEEELQECREKVKNQISGIIEQLEQVAKVISAATHQRVWDHFTKPQRKNIETWQKMTQEFNRLKEEFNEKFFGDDIDMNGFTNRSNIMDVHNEELQELKRENESLRFQLEAYKNEVDVIKADTQKEMEKFKAQFIARQALQDSKEKNPPLPSPLSKPPPPPPLPEDSGSKAAKEEEIECGEAKLIGIMSAFLQTLATSDSAKMANIKQAQKHFDNRQSSGIIEVHPQGASLDYVVSYVRALFPAVSQAAIHHVLQRHADVFRRTTRGVGANIEHRWAFVAYNDAN